MCRCPSLLLLLLLLPLLLPLAASTPGENPCLQERRPGPCRGAYPRWYHEAKSGKCREFSWGGCQANGNNFETQEECQKRCQNRCAQSQEAGPCRGAWQRWYYDRKARKCSLFDWGGCNANGNNFETLDVCNSLCNNPCLEPRDKGTCDAATRRWYYDSNSGKCLGFKWGGCGSSRNNFETLDACNERCHPCYEPHEVGPCRARKPRWYYSVKKKECVKFSWGGCRANGNNFRTVDECNNRCEPSLQLVIDEGTLEKGGQTRKKEDEDDITPYPCGLPASSGRCYAYFTRYYFDAKSKKCKEFVYGGCGGNRNNYESIDQCKKACGG